MSRDQIRKRDTEGVWGIFFPFVNREDAERFGDSSARKLGLWGRIVQVTDSRYNKGKQISPVRVRKGANTRDK